MIPAADINDFDTLKKAYEEIPSIQGELEKKFRESDLRNRAAELQMEKEYQELTTKPEAIAPTPSSFKIGDQILLLPPNHFFDKSGAIKKMKGENFEEICSHNIAITAKAKNIDSGHTKIRLYWRRNGEQRTEFFSAKTISCRDIVDLSLMDIDVTTANANKLIKFLQDFQKFNGQRIANIKSVGRCGWLKTDAEENAAEIFSPYSEDVLFDGRDEVGNLFNAINNKKGSVDTWVEGIRKARENPVIKTVIAASLASILIKRVGGLPFILHLWGPTGTGKTVALHIASSIWGERHEYTKNFNATKIGIEQVCAFLNNLPLVLDELQIKKNARDFDNLIYSLTQGSGRTRGKREGGFQNAQTWKNVIITSGEAPISKAHSGGGALNRVLEIQCDTNLFEDFDNITNLIDENYGALGREFVKVVQATPDSELKKVYAEILKRFKNRGLAEKQYRSAAMILLADKLFVEHFLGDTSYIGLPYIEQFVKRLDDVDSNLKAFEYLGDIIAANYTKFSGEDRECWGAEDDKYIYMLKPVFDKVLFQEGYEPQAVISWLKRNGKIKTGQKNTLTKRIQGKVARCVWLRQDSEGLAEDEV